MEKVNVLLLVVTVLSFIFGGGILWKVVYLIAKIETQGKDIDALKEKTIKMITIADIELAVVKALAENTQALRKILDDNYVSKTTCSATHRRHDDRIN